MQCKVNRPICIFMISCYLSFTFFSAINSDIISDNINLILTQDRRPLAIAMGVIISKTRVEGE